MRRYGEFWLKEAVAQKMKLAASFGEYWGKPVSPSDRMYLYDCTADHVPSGTRLIFTRDVGHHESGWFKNPDYDRCYHLSLSFREPDTGGNLPQNRKLAEEWCRIFFGDEVRKLWVESPKTPHGREADVWHYRLFCDEHWLPILPRGEVYSTEFTELGWRSWSELHGDEPEIVRSAG